MQPSRPASPSRVSPFSRRIIQLPIAIGIILFMVRLLQWSLPFPVSLLTLLLQLVLFCVLGFGLLWSIAHGIRQFRRQKMKALVPVAINAIVLLILLSFPFLTVWLRLNFAIMESARTEVVSLVQSGQLTANERGQIELPPSYSLTSEGGQVEQEDSDLLFYTFRGIDNYAGFVYSRNPAPAIGTTKFSGKVVEVAQFQPQWFWISAT